MRILHTSDWHIGKKLMGRERYDEYVSVLNEICAIAENEGVELTLVAGDVYDSYTPSAQSEEIFYNAIKKLSSVCAVLIISGNHDDYVRLTAAFSVVQELNVYIIGNNLQKISCAKRGKCYPVDSDSGYIIFENERGERVYINTLPYPNEARFKESKSDESFNEKVQRWIDFGERGKPINMPSIFLSHIFVNGGKPLGSEREIDLGGARLVGADQIPDCGYAALGHLHKGQKLTERNIYYCGAPMRFSFDESGDEKWVNVFDINESGVDNFKRVILKDIKNLARLQANSVQSAVDLLNNYEQSFVELTLNLTAPLTPEDSQMLRGFKNLLHLKCEVQPEHINSEITVKEEASASTLFTEYYKLRYGVEPPENLLTLFLSLTEEE